MKLIYKETKAVMLLYFFSITGLLLSCIDNIPLKGIFNKIQYIFILVSLVMIIKNGVLAWNRKVCIAFGAIVLHTILFCLVFKNDRIADGTAELFRGMIITYAFTFSVLFYVYINNLFLQFLKCSYYGLAIQTIWCALTHKNDFVNPIYFVNIFSKGERYRADFGYGDVNYCGNYCVYALIVAFFLLQFCRKKQIKINNTSIVLICVCTFFQLNMLLSTASRSGILSLIMFLSLFYFFQSFDWIKTHWKVIFPALFLVALVGVILLASTEIMTTIWGESNREGNYSINYPIYRMYSNQLIGMGYMDNSGFLNKAYGFETTAMDVYYLYILFSTGIIGMTIIVGQMIYLFLNIVWGNRTMERNLTLSFYLTMLFYAVWQVNYMNSRYVTGVIEMVIIFYYLLHMSNGKYSLFIKVKN